MELIQTIYNACTTDFTTLKTESLLKTLTFFLAFILLLLFSGLCKKGRGKNLPPGPAGLPFVGYLPFLTKAPHAKFQELSKKYGNIISLYLGRQLVVVLGDVDLLRDTFGREEFHARPEAPSVLTPGAFKKNISGVNGKDWVEQRKIMILAIKAFGKGNEFVEGVIGTEMERFLEHVEQSKGQPIDIKPITSTCIANVVSVLTWGKSYEHGSSAREYLNQYVQDFVEHADMTSIQQFFKWLMWMPLVNKYGGWDKYIRQTYKLHDLLKNEVEEHKETLDPNNIRDYLDACLIQEQRAKDKGQYTSCDYEMLIGNLFVLITAGGETVRTSLHWAFLVLTAHPEVQARIQKEIDEVVGPARKPVWADQKSMPYAMSVLMEVERLYTIVPLNVFRWTTADVKVGDYDIPKDTLVLSNLWNVLHDPSHWTDPETFKPERFLDESGKAIVKPKSYLPFSFGKRICPGESLAMMELFIFLTSTLQKYDVCLPSGSTLNLTPDYFVTTQPKEQRICMKPRQLKH